MVRFYSKRIKSLLEFAKWQKFTKEKAFFLIWILQLAGEISYLHIAALDALLHTEKYVN